MSHRNAFQPYESLRVEVITDRTSLDEIAPDWDALAVAAAHASPLSTHAWFTTQIDENEKLRRNGQVRWRCFVAYDGLQLVGVMPLIEEPWNWRGLRGPAVRVPGEYYSRSGEPLLDDACSTRALEALIDAVRAWRPGVPLELGGLRDGRPGPLNDLRARPRVRTRQAESGRMIATDGSAEAWFTGLSRNHRKNLARRARRLEEAFPGDVQYRVAVGPDVAPILEDFARLEMSGWKGDAGIALLTTPSTMRFYRRLCVRLAERGWLEWHLLEVAGTPIVVDMWVRIGGTMAGLYTAYDERYAFYSPGALRLQRTIEEAFASECTRIVDVLTESAWTEHWGMETYNYHSALLAMGNPFPLWIDDGVQTARSALRPFLAPMRDSLRLGVRSISAARAGTSSSYSVAKSAE